MREILGRRDDIQCLPKPLNALGIHIALGYSSRVASRTARSWEGEYMRKGLGQEQVLSNQTGWTKIFPLTRHEDRPSRETWKY